MVFKDIYLFVKKSAIDVLQVIFPTTCCACNAFLMHFEDEICIKCRQKLPFITSTKQHQLFDNQIFENYFFVQKTYFLFDYHKKGKIQQLIHNFKYKKPKKIGVLLGDWHSYTINKSHFTDKIDLVIVVPLHKNKLKIRGYNQLEHYAKTIANSLNAEFSSKVLLKIKETKTQSKQNKNERFKNMKDSIVLNSNTDIKNKHVLLLDDIVTTGATMEACLSALKNVEHIKVSIGAIGITLQN